MQQTASSSSFFIQPSLLPIEFSSFSYQQQQHFQTKQYEPQPQPLDFSLSYFGTLEKVHKWAAKGSSDSSDENSDDVNAIPHHNSTVYSHCCDFFFLSLSFSLSLFLSFSLFLSLSLSLSSSLPTQLFL
jgi:hypothetical protein